MMVRRLLAALTGLGVRHPGKVLAAAALATAAALLPVFLGGRFETDLEKLIPPDKPHARVFREAMQDFGIADVLLIVFEALAADAARIRALEPVLPDVAADLRTLSGYVERVEYMVGEEQEAFFRKNLCERAFFYLEPSEYEQVRQKFTTAGIEQSLERARALFKADTALFRQRVIPDPLNMFELFENRLARLGGQFRRGGSRYFTSPDGSLLLMLVRPVRPVQDLAFDRELMVRVRASVQGTLERAVSDGRLAADALAGLSVGYGGAYPCAVHDDQALRQDIFATFGVSILAVLALFGLAFRRLGMVFYVGAPLAASVLWTIGLAFALFGRVSIISGGSAAILVGLGIDFAIHLYNRYAEERQSGAELAAALVHAAALTGQGVLFGALTTAIAFYAVCITRFKPLAELGFLAGTGVLLEMLSMLLVLPAMLVLRERLATSRPFKAEVFGFGLARLAGCVKRLAAPLSILIFGGGALAGWYMLTHVEPETFDSEFRNLKPLRHPVHDLNDRVMQKMRTNTDNVYFISTGADTQEALERAAALRPRLDALIAEGEFLGYQSLADYVPPLRRQQEALEFLKGIDFERVRADFVAAAHANGFKEQAFADFLKRLDTLARLIEQPEWVSIEEMQRAGLATFLKRYYAVHGGQVRIVTHAQPRLGEVMGSGPEGQARHRGLPSEWFEAQAEALGADHQTLIMTSARQLAFELRDLVSSDFSLIIALVTAGVVACLLATFRHPVRVLTALLPLAAGFSCMVAVYLLAGLKVNYVNIVVLPAIIGIGIDNGIHILHRYIDERDISLVVGRTGRALMMSSLTTMLGFGSLLISRFPGMRSLGELAVTGVFTCLVCSLVGLPALLHWLGRYAAAVEVVESGDGVAK